MSSGRPNPGDPRHGLAGSGFVRAGLEGLPGVGGVFSAFISLIPEVRRADALDTFELILQLCGERPEAVRAVLARSEGAFHLVAEVLETSARTAMGRKRQVLARIAAEAITDPTKIDEALFRARTWAQLEELHVAALGIVETHTPQPVADRVHLYDRLSGSRAVSEAILQDLNRLGLVTMPVGFGGGVTVQVTDYGRELLAELAATVVEHR